MRFKIIATVAAATLVATLTGCATGAPDTMTLQQAATNAIGLASTDEMTLSNVRKSPPNLLGGTIVSYTATTTKGRKFNCTAFLTPGMPPLTKDQYSNFKCEPA